MTVFLICLLLLAQLWLVTAVLLWLHHLSRRFGPAFFLIFLGAITAALQTNIMGPIHIQIDAASFTLTQGSFILLPALLLGLLIVYIVNGTRETRTALISIVGITFVVALSQTFKSISIPIQGGSVDFERSAGIGFHELVASALVLGIDLIIMIVTYQAVCNLRQRFPSRTAASLALLAAVVADAILYPLLSSWKLPAVSMILLLHVGGKSLAILSLWPLTNAYLTWFAPGFPDSDASHPRPALDLFTTTRQVEARARLQQSLLRTISQINQLIIHTRNPQELLDQACQLLVDHRDYPLAWFGLVVKETSKSAPTLQPVSIAGTNDYYLKEFQKGTITPVWGSSSSPLQTGKPAIYADLSRQLTHVPEAITALNAGCQASAVFPMRHTGVILGLMQVYATHRNAFNKDEADLLQELADDLAYALISLEARQQQTILHTATESMQDGLFITNTEGVVLYANPAIARLLGSNVGELEGQKLVSILPNRECQNIFAPHQDFLKQNPNTDLEMELMLGDRHPVHLSVRISTTHNSSNHPAYVVINIQDISRHHQYESQLLTLSRFTSDLVQVFDTNLLMERGFHAAEELLLADASAAVLISETGTPSEEYYSHNLTEHNPASRLYVVWENAVEQTILSRLPLYLSVDDGNTADRQVHAWMLENGVHGILTVPLLFKEIPVGALAVFYRRPYILQSEELRLGMTLAQTTAIAVQNARLYQAERNQRQFAEALARGAAALNNSLDVDTVLTKILEQTMQVEACRAVNLMLIEEENARVVRHVDRSHPDEEFNINTGIVLPVSTPTLQQMLSTGKPLIIPNTLTDPMWQRLDQTSWICSYAAAPLQVQGEIIGFLNLNSDIVGHFVPAINPRLQAFADTAAAAIQNARLYQDSIRQSQDLSALLGAAALVTTSLDYNQVLMAVAEQMAHTLDIRGCAISNYDPATNTVQLLAEFGPPEWWNNPNSHKPYDLSLYPLTSRVLETRKPVVLHINDPDLDPAERDYMTFANITTMMMLALSTQDRTLGLVELIDDTQLLSFSQRQIDLIQALGTHAAIAIENARLYQNVQQYAAELEDRVAARTSELSVANERLAGILVPVPDAIIVLDEHLNLVQANPAGETLLARARSNGIDLFSAEFVASLSAPVTSSGRTILEIDGRAYQALASSLPEHNATTGNVIVFRDATHFRDLDQVKTRFVSDVSHELRTPLTNLSLYLELLAGNIDTSKTPRYLGVLRRETERLTHLIEGLLTISRLEADRIDIKIEPVDINRLVGELSQDRAQMAASRHIALTCTTMFDLPRARADHRLVTQVVSNLLTNALNYTPEDGSIHIYTAMNVANNENWVTVSIQDNGLGIQPEEMQHLFTRFFRGSASQTSGAPGTGLGLAITRDIMDRLNGRITVESQWGTGSTFTVWLQAVL